MANNRLYIEDTDTGERILVAKSFGRAWDWRVDREQMNEWIDDMNGLRDMAASFGSAPSSFRFVTENEVNDAKP